MNQTYQLKELIFYFLKLGTWGFGGPVALVEYMHRDLVEGKKWISESEYREGLALAQLAPGPLAAQLSIYMGYVHHGVKGATLSGFAFVIPSFLMVVGIGFAYVKFEGLPFITALFYGVGASVIGIIAMSSYRLIKKTIGTDIVAGMIFLVLFACTLAAEQEILWLILAGGIFSALVKIPGLTINTILLFPWAFAEISLPVSSKLLDITWFFTKAGAFVFGSGLAIVPFLYGGVVKEYHWLTEQQFMDAVAVAMITPGPVVITVGFIGYLVAGFPGACAAALATFLPCYLFTVIPAPYFKQYGKLPGIKAFVEGVTAGAVGAIAGAVIVLARRTLNDIPTVLIAVAAMGALLTFRKLKEPWVILLAAISGILVNYVLKN